MKKWTVEANEQIINTNFNIVDDRSSQRWTLMEVTNDTQVATKCKFLESAKKN